MISKCGTSVLHSTIHTMQRLCSASASERSVATLKLHARKAPRLIAQVSSEEPPSDSIQMRPRPVKFQNGGASASHLGLVCEALLILPTSWTN